MRCVGDYLRIFIFEISTWGQVAHAVITVDFNYEEGGKGTFTPVVRDFTVDHIVSKKSKYAFDVQGLTSAPVYDLRLKDCTFDNVADGNTMWAGFLI